MPLKRRAAPRAEIMGWDGSAWQRILVESSANPNLRVGIFDGTVQAAVTSIRTDGRGNDADTMMVESCPLAYNESTWDRWRNNTEKTVLPSGTRTTSGSGADQTNFNARGVILYTRVTAVSGTDPTLRIQVDAKDPATGRAKTYCGGVTITAVGDYLLIVYPGASREWDATRDEVWDNPLPRTWRVYYVIGGTNPSFTFSVGAMYIV